MNALALAIDPIAHAERLRTQFFVLLMGSATVCGALLGFGSGGAVAYLLVPAYVGWVVNDLRVRRVSSGLAVIQFAIALFPFWGLLGYLLLTRRLVGAMQWLCFCCAMMVPAALAGMLTRAVCALAKGEHW